MNFEKVKNIFIYVFLSTLIILTYLIYYYDADAKMVTDADIDVAIKMMADKNITVDKKGIKKKYTKMYYIDLKNPIASKSDFAHLLTGSSVGVNNSYNGVNGKLYINGGEFTYIPKYKGEGFGKTTDSARAAGDVLKIFATSYGLNTDCIKWNGSVLKGDYSEVSYIHYFNSYKIYDTDLKVLIKPDGIYKVSGRYFQINGILKAGQMKSPAEILILFARDNKDNHISKVETGYYVSEGSDIYTNLTGIPIYRISAKDGIYYYDAIEGDLVNFVEYK